MSTSANPSVTLWKLSALVLVCLLAACNQAVGIAVTDSTSTAVPMTEADSVSTATPLSPNGAAISPLPTDIPPTDTALPPTERSMSPTPVPISDTSTAAPTAALQEVIVSQPAEIIGAWESERGSQIIFTQSGGARIIDRAGDEMAGIGTFHFENEQLVLDSNTCLSFQAGFGNAAPCTAFYTIYLLTMEDEVVGLRFLLVEDPYRDRKNAMTGVDWLRPEE